MIEPAKKPGRKKPAPDTCPAEAGLAGARFATRMQRLTLGQALASWPRRNASLLEVNCGSGAFSRFLWQCGFDAQATETDPALRALAARRHVPGLQIYAACEDDLPFEDDYFDWVVIHLKNPELAALKDCAREGSRLARRGVMLTFWNSASIPCLAWRLTRKKPWPRAAAPWWRIWRALRSLRMGQLTCLSTLAAPLEMWKWQKRSPGPFGLPVGAWCVMRLDWQPGVPVTPMPLRLGASISSPEPVLENMNTDLIQRDKP